MILVVDAGNSRLKWAFAEEHLLTDHGAVAYDRDLDAILDEHWLAGPRPERVVFCSVASARVAEELVLWSTEVWDLEPERVRALPAGYGIESAYERPETLGADRFAAMVAAHRMGGAACIVDAGTAITVDAIDAGGHHRGGVICAGVALTRNALTTSTARIGPETGDPDAVPARSTPDALAAGTVLAAVAGVDRAVAACEAALGGTARHILTGGEADLLAERLAGDWEPVPDLVLRGLAAIAEGDAR